MLKAYFRFGVLEIAEGGDCKIVFDGDSGYSSPTINNLKKYICANKSLPFQAFFIQKLRKFT